MESLLSQCFAPTLLFVASDDCKEFYDHPAIADDDRFVTLSDFETQRTEGHHALQPDPEKLISDVRKQKPDADPEEFFSSVVKKLVVQTTRGKHAQPFETWGHPLACILMVSSSNPNPISELTQLYQQSYAHCPTIMSSDFLCCVIYFTQGADAGAESFTTVSSQFGPHCYEIKEREHLQDVIETVTSKPISAYMDHIVQQWQTLNSSRSLNGFGFGKLLKKFVNQGPQRPETNLFAQACQDLQPHVASIPARRRNCDLDMQLRRLADVAFILKDYKLARSAYDSLKKLFSAEQKWAHLGSACEMSAICGALLRNAEISNAVDTALYTYNSRVRLSAHALRCILLVCGCLVEFGNQLLAAGVLSTALQEIDALPGSNNSPAETAMLMERTALAFEKRGWQRKTKLWNMLAAKEWKLVAK